MALSLNRDTLLFNQAGGADAGGGVPAGAGAPPVPSAPAAPTAAPTAAPAPTPPASRPVATPSQEASPPTSPAVPEPDWFGKRISRAKETGRSEILRELGVESMDAAKTAVAAARAAEEAKKTTEERNVSLKAQLDAELASKQTYSGIIQEQAGRMLMALTPEQQKAVTEFAGDDPVQQLRAIQHFAPTWAALEHARREEDVGQLPATGGTAQENGAAPIPGQVPPAAPPANTSPAPGAPPDTGAGSPPDHRATYEATRQRNPFAAAAYGLQNPSAYERKQ